MLPDGFIFVAEPLAAPGVVPDVLPAPFMVPLPEPVVPPLAPDAAGFQGGHVITQLTRTAAAANDRQAAPLRYSGLLMEARHDQDR